MKSRLRSTHRFIRAREMTQNINQELMVSPLSMLKTLLDDFCENTRHKFRRYSAFAKSPNCSDLKLVKEIQTLLDHYDETDHVVSVVARLNAHGETHKLSSELADLLSMYFSMYEQYRVHFNDALSRQLCWHDVWLDRLRAGIDILLAKNDPIAPYYLDKFAPYFDARQRAFISPPKRDMPLDEVEQELYAYLGQGQTKFTEAVKAKLCDPETTGFMQCDIVNALGKWQKVFSTPTNIYFIELLIQVLLRDVPEDSPILKIILEPEIAIRVLSQLLKNIPLVMRQQGIQALWRVGKQDLRTSYFHVIEAAVALMEVGSEIGINHIHLAILRDIAGNDPVDLRSALEHAQELRPWFRRDMRTKLVTEMLSLVFTYDNDDELLLLRTLTAYRKDMDLDQIISMLCRLNDYMQRNEKHIDVEIVQLMADMYEVYCEQHAFMLLQRVPVESAQYLPAEIAEQIVTPLRYQS